MTSRTTASFQALFRKLPAQVQRQVRRAYQLFRQNPTHPSLRFKPVHPSEPIYSVRISKDYRAVGMRSGDEIIWFWVGSHADYDRLLSQWRRKP